jgi:hypothetical protein
VNSPWRCLLVKVSATVMHDMAEGSHGMEGNICDHPVGTVSRKLYGTEEAIQIGKLDLNDNGMSLCTAAGGSRNYFLVKDSTDVV